MSLQKIPYRISTCANLPPKTTASYAVSLRQFAYLLFTLKDTDGLLARGYMSVNGCDNGISLCEVLDPFIHNPYDTVLRVYMIDSRNSEPSLKLTHALKGHKNKNWPIKSSFVRYSPCKRHFLNRI